MRLDELIRRINGDDYHVAGDPEMFNKLRDVGIFQLVGSFWNPDGRPGGIVSLRPVPNVKPSGGKSGK
jgi:hypothetical protein